jgi:iron complex outermembrane recepter protein
LDKRRARSTLTFLAPAAALALTAVLADARPAFAQEESAITGRVVSKSTGEPLVGATVTVSSTGAGVFTDEQGRFQIQAPPGRHSIEISFSGYAPETEEIEIGGDAAGEVTISLRDDPRYAETIVIVGARTPRSVTKSPVPIDVITSEQIQEAGEVETNQVLRTVAPSYNASHQSISDGTDHVDPASLRGLGPDQTLVLLNNKRRHSSALVNVNGTFGRGTVGTDLNAIPSTAIERIEVLRDGAAAQYGSDAIAGVVNIELKEQPGVVEATAMSGIHGEGDGFQVLTGVNGGVPIGDSGGVLNLTAEFVQRGSTDRAGDYTGDFYPGIEGTAATDAELSENGLDRQDISMDIGQAEATVGMFFYNARIPVGENEVYGTGGVSYRQGAAAGFYRRPNQLDRVDLELYPDGFLPEIHPDSLDWSAGAGFRKNRDAGGLLWDVSVNHGGNMFDYTIENSTNASYSQGDEGYGQTTFDSGGFVFHQTTANADVVYPFEVQALKRLALNGGAEYRLESYAINAGELASYEFGGRTYVDPADGMEKATVPGAQVFPGFTPDNELSETRNSAAAYLGLETEFNDRFLVDVAGRFENFQDFGSTINGKIAGRVAIIEQIALRAAASTGFRAPSLHQVYFNNTSTQFTPNEEGVLTPNQVLTVNNDNQIARDFGIPELEEETSLNGSGGITITPLENLSLTADAYYIAIDNRIVLTSQFTEMAVPGTADLLPANVTAAQFFSNAVDTETIGTDVVVDFWNDLGKGRLGMTAAANFTRTEVKEVNVPQGVADTFGDGNLEAVEGVIFNREERNRLEDALPRQKGFLQARYSLGDFAGLVRGNYYGPVEFKTVDETLDEEFSAKVTLDADVSLKLPAGFKVAVGGTNVLNTFPDEQEIDVNRSDGQFVYSRRVTQFGVNGGFYYLRLQYLY